MPHVVQDLTAVRRRVGMMVVGDVNGDGRLDVAAANYSSNSVSVLLGNGNGTFAAQKTFGVGTSPFSITTATATLTSS